jgi:hypothetical protein
MGTSMKSSHSLEIQLAVLNELIRTEEIFLSQLRLRKYRIEKDIKIAKARNE